MYFPLLAPVTLGASNIPLRLRAVPFVQTDGPLVALKERLTLTTGRTKTTSA